jgi:hypothetical protein
MVVDRTQTLTQNETIKKETGIERKIKKNKEKE